MTPSFSTAWEREEYEREQRTKTTDQKIAEHVETLQLALSQVQNAELRDDAEKALAAILKAAAKSTAPFRELARTDVSPPSSFDTLAMARLMQEVMASDFRRLMQAEPVFVETRSYGEPRGQHADQIIVDDIVTEPKPPAGAQWWYTDEVVPKDAKTAQFIEVYKMGRARNHKGKGLKHRP